MAFRRGRNRSRSYGFMYGRYGTDQFSIALLVVALVLVFMSFFIHWAIGYLGMAAAIWAIMRSWSRDTAARARENARFLSVCKAPVSWARISKKRWVNRKTTRYIKCARCHRYYAVPKGKGKIRVTCPHCHAKSIHTT